MNEDIFDNKIILQLLANRGITQKDDIIEFVSGKPQTNYNPFLLHNMEAGVDLIISEINNGSKICIYGDYDADGITATVMMLEILGSVTDSIGYHIPSRFDEGYGLNKEAIDLIKNRGYNFIITVDCGSSSKAEIEYAKEQGITVLVTDHHNMGKEKLPCLVINPKQAECKYPFKNIAGCGVAFKLAQALVEKGLVKRRLLTAVLDLLAIGTIGDVMPLVDENRSFVKYGLRCIDTNNRISIKALKDLYLQKQKHITSEAVSFSIVPPINAPGRLGDATLAVKFLLARNEQTARKLAMELVETNEKRKQLQNEAFSLCEKIVDEHYVEDKFLMVKIDNIHEGITGIVAGKIKEKYNKPTVVLTQSGKYLKASGRSITQVNIYDMLSVYQNEFIRFGGHAGACGFTVDEPTYQSVRRRIQSQMIELEKHIPNLYNEKESAELILSPNEVDLNLVRQIALLEPFGNGNPKPVFAMNNVGITNIKFIGDNDQHVVFSISQNCNTLRCIMFNYPKEIIRVLRNGKANIIGTLELNYWRDRENMQFHVRNMEEADVKS